MTKTKKKATKKPTVGQRYVKKLMAKPHAGKVDDRCRVKLGRQRCIGTFGHAGLHLAPARERTRYATEPHELEWNDGTLELYRPNGTACSMPVCCPECDGQFFLGDTMCAVSDVEVVHMMCFDRYAKSQGWKPGMTVGAAR